MTTPMIYADFHNADAAGRVRLNCVGTLEDLAEQQVELREGMAITLRADDLDEQGQSDDLVVEGTVTYSADERCWVAVIDWSAIRHSSELSHSGGNGSPPGVSDKVARTIPRN